MSSFFDPVFFVITIGPELIHSQSRLELPECVSTGEPFLPPFNCPAGQGDYVGHASVDVGDIDGDGLSDTLSFFSHRPLPIDFVIRPLSEGGEEHEFDSVGLLRFERTSAGPLEVPLAGLTAAGDGVGDTRVRLPMPFTLVLLGIGLAPLAARPWLRHRGRLRR